MVQINPCHDSQYIYIYILNHVISPLIKTLNNDTKSAVKKIN